VLLSAGRFTKFESAWYWRAVGEILASRPDAVYVVIGITELPAPAREVLNGMVAGRVRTIGWQKDYLQILLLADVVLDTYPSGGGAVLMDAMALGIPAVSFANDYLHEFDQTDWSLGNEIVVIPELVVPRGDFTALVGTVGRLLDDSAERSRLGRQCRDLVVGQRGDASRMIRGWETLFERVVDEGRMSVRVPSSESASRTPAVTDVVPEAGRPPLVSIVTPAYNRADFLAETIESVLSQDYPHVEFLVLDDGSTDDTPAVLERYAGRLLAVRHPNMGETATVNRGLAMARGDILCVVNSDDPLLPDAISTAVRYLADHPEVLAAYPDWVEIDPDSRVINTLRLPQYDLPGMLRDFNVAMGPGTFFRRTVLERIGFRKGTLRYTGDLDFWFRIARVGQLGHIEAVLATHRTHPGAASSAERGKRMAAEIPLLAEGAFAGGDTFAGLNRREVFATAHWAAADYCGSNLRERLKHRLLACAWHPLRALRLGALEFINAHFQTLDRWRRRLWRLRERARLGDRWPALRRWAAVWRGARRSGAGSGFALVSHVLPPSWSGQAVVLGRILANLEPDQYCLIATAVPPEGRVSRLSAPTGPEGRRHAVAREPWPALWSVRGVLGWLDTGLRIVVRGWKIARILESENCGVVLAATGDLVDLPAAFLASRIAGAGFVPYLFDDYAEQWGFAPWLRRRARFLESRILPRAAAVIVPNEFLQEEIRRRYGILPAIVRNPCESAALDQEVVARRESGAIRIVYTGALYHANASAFRLLLAGIRLCESRRITLHLYTAQSPDTLAREGISGEDVVVHAHVPPEEVGTAQTEADILFLGFAFDSPIPEVIRTSAPGKLGDYLAAGRPILAIAPENAFLSHYLARHDCGRVVAADDPLSVAEAIRELLENPELGDRLARHARQRARVDFNPRKAAEALLEAVRSALG
jgi:glycosyltransferase involved in cell wall biosynthesis